MNRKRFIPKIKFPKLKSNITSNSGIVTFTSDITPELIYNAYIQGLFPWPYKDEDIIPWFFPEPRAVLEFDEFHIPKRTSQYLKKANFSFRMNTCFDRIIRECASVPRKTSPGSWITEKLIKAYSELFEWGYAWSGECFHNGTLVGGIYGVIINNIPEDYFNNNTLRLIEIVIPDENNRNGEAGNFAYISGESMFHKVSNASKFALIESIKYFRTQRFTYMDIQVLNHLTKMFGGKNISSEDFIKKQRFSLCKN